MKKLLALSDVSFTYHTKDFETKALENVTFDVNEGDFVAIVGPSGSGKSTILAILSGLLTPSGGNITLDGMPLSANPNYTALMPQKDQLFEWRTILKNVTLGLEVQKSLNSSTLSYAKDLLKKYGLEDCAKKHPSELSGGMRQRVALIRTLVTKPRLMLLDESFSALDFQTRLSVCNDVSRILKQEKKTAILVTHDISEAISLADKVIILSNRPAVVKEIITIDMDKSLSPLEKREQPIFQNYFKEILAKL